MKNTKLFFATLCCLSWTMAVVSFCTEECKAPGIGYTDSMIKQLSNELKKAECSLYDQNKWPEDYAEQIQPEDGVMDAFDYVVIGAGTAGSIVASRLSEDSSIKVLVLEEGGDPPKESEMSLMTTLFRTDYMWNDYSMPNENSCLSMIDDKCYWAHGKMIGGSGGANGNIFLTGTREDYDGWSRLENREWSWQTVSKYFLRAKHQRGNDSHPIGAVTLNLVKHLPEHLPMTNLIYQAAQEIGLPIIDNFDEEHNIGVSTNIWTTTEKGRRMSTAKTYLAKVAHKRTNLKIMKYASATKIRINKFNRAEGVDLILQNKFNLRVNVRHEVILSAGALNSPKILMHSGIGPRDHLESLGIPCRKHLQVGENLQDHGVMPIFFKIKRGKLSTFDERAHLLNIFKYFLYSDGAMVNAFHLFGYVNSDPNSSSPYPDMQILTPHTIPVGSRMLQTAYGLKPAIYDIIEAAAEKHEMFVMYALLMKPKTRGRISLHSNNVFDAPIINFEYGKHPADKEAVVRFVRYLQRMENTIAFKAYDLEMIHAPLPKCAQLPYDSDEYWICFAKYFLLGSYHPAGTCKMGPLNDPDAVVDERLNVHGVKGLRVIDASIMPTITSGNTNGPTIMIGEKGAAMVIKDLQGEKKLHNVDSMEMT